MPYKDPEKRKLKQREYNKKHYEKYKERRIEITKESKRKSKEFVNKLKEKGCSICGEEEIVCLDFHHLRDKDKGIASAIVYNWSIKRIEKEIEKCILVCSNCHRKIHAQILLPS